MNCAFRLRRGSDLQLCAVITREGYHRYVADVYAVQSGRHIDVVPLTARNKRDAFKQLRLHYPSITLPTKKRKRRR